MKIFFDHQIFSLQRFGGISRYFCEIYKGLDKLGQDVHFSTRYSNNFYLKQHNKQHIKDFLPNFNITGKHIIDFFINKYFSIKELKLGNFDIFHPTFLHPYFLKYIGDKKYVITIHDMLHEIYPRKKRFLDKSKEYGKIIANKASRIIAVSENTKKDIIKYYDINPEKIDVIYHGSSFTFQDGEEIDKKYKLPKRYILFVGHRSGYKNFDKFLDSITPILKGDNKLNLICTGGNKFNQKELEKIEKMGLKSQIKHFFVDDKNLKFFYKNAEIFVFPSIYEGFGIPILEAFSAGVPTVISNTSCFPEIAQNGAEYFDPNSQNDMYEKIKNVIENKIFKQNLINNGKQRLKFFSREKTSQETLNVYQKVLKI